MRYRGPSVWRAYRGTVLTGAGVLAIQSLLIVGLLYERRARRRAETESRKNLALAADASRRQTMAALTSSIAHELGQPLSAMIHNAQALQMMVSANRAPSGTIAEVLSDIQTQGVKATQIIDRHRTMLRSRQLDMKPIDLHAVIDESLALVDHELAVRQIDANIDLPSSPCIISGDPVLLQQVLVNLMINAMDAMAGTPRAAASRHDKNRSPRGRRRALSERHRYGLISAARRQPVHAIRDDESARPRDRTHDRAHDRRRTRRHHRRPQQSGRRGDVHCHAAPRGHIRPPGSVAAIDLFPRSRFPTFVGGQCCPSAPACC